MPELPEVETVAAGLRLILLGQTIEKVVCGRKPLRYPIDVRMLRQICRKNEVVNIRRRGKYMGWELANGQALLVHLGMSGRFYQTAAKAAAVPHDHAVFHLQNATELRYSDPRRFGAIIPIPNGQWQAHELIAALGPEPLVNIDIERLQALASHRTIPIKQLLLDQSVLAGIGNIYASEILFRANLHPLTPANHLTLPQWQILTAAITETLRYAINVGGTTLRDGGFVDVAGQYGGFQIELSVYGQVGDLCKSCRTGIETVRIAGRSSFFCPKCQKLA